ncbi:MULTISPECIES: hypothetical protein [Aeromonas]|uniref:hypothetical protein n=1 Tax=Aeromonas TaxID=642 RepID=UPI000D689D51|nr:MULTISPECIES: hypothetical protein [Aeromonas]MBS4695263.1 hypothetical protein [Aeromonas allosaccharophila]TNI98898.1 hypothetical protein CF114_09655 [Aeromonas veronii]
MITIEDWSHIRKAKVRHALFCVAYRVLQGDSLEKACRTTAKSLKRDYGRLRLLARHYIKTTKTTTGDNTK